MNDLKIFENKEFGEIRTVVKDGEPWFVGKDVAEILGHSNPQRALRDYIDDDDKGVTKIVTPGGTQTMAIINESGLYSLILSSKLPNAKKFKKWVTSEVLPSIRKTGGYQKPLTSQEMMRLQLGMIDDVSDRVSKLENTMTIDYSQQKTLTDLMSSTVVTWLGGKNTCAYEELSKKVFAEIGRDYKDYFNVNARANTPSLRFEEAVDYIKSWKPSTNTLKLISSLNI
ncbi:phage repressor protein [Coprococcus sp. AF19-8AC]|uniref:BRO family protein n=1 Tax=Coprococcus sp. AF19-8AC TaxID=2293090 RepID=UPI000E729080|nr:BRO family protein [Coprococcus sp. AF19-8AC]RJV45977.1 phage repressor protein [Coprococcus sp. AF19-8AC]